MRTPRHDAATAAHRFGLGEPDLAALRDDPRGWVMAQLQAPVAPDGTGLADTAAARALGRRVLRQALGAAPQGGDAAAAMAPAAAASAAVPETAVAVTPERRALRQAELAALQRRWQHMVATPTPVAERWVQFWANHFSVAATKGAMLGLVWPYEREAIRPHAFGPFAGLLRAATLHPAMLLYLDNAQSFGPASPVGLRRGRGLNENLARELLELHTLGVDGGYTQADVSEGARVLTGWTVPRDEVVAVATPATATAAAPADRGIFVAALHEPGPKQVLGRRYAEGPEAAARWLDDLARHPSTARHLATKLVRHFVADVPPQTLVDAVAARWRSSDGDLLAVAQALFGHALAWRDDTPAKYKRPEEWMLSAHRLLQRPVGGLPETAQRAQALAAMGQPPGRAPSPQGWPDREADWLSPDALWQRVEGAAQAARRWADGGAGSDARALATASLGPALGAATARQLAAADSPSQALALLLASPEFLRR